MATPITPSLWEAAPIAVGNDREKLFSALKELQPPPKTEKWDRSRLTEFSTKPWSIIATHSDDLFPEQVHLFVRTWVTKLRKAPPNRLPFDAEDALNALVARAVYLRRSGWTMVQEEASWWAVFQDLNMEDSCFVTDRDYMVQELVNAGCVFAQLQLSQPPNGAHMEVGLFSANRCRRKGSSDRCATTSSGYKCIVCRNEVDCALYGFRNEGSVSLASCGLLAVFSGTAFELVKGPPWLSCPRRGLWFSRPAGVETEPLQFTYDRVQARAFVQSTMDSDADMKDLLVDIQTLWARRTTRRRPPSVPAGTTKIALGPQSTTIFDRSRRDVNAFKDLKVPMGFRDVDDLFRYASDYEKLARSLRL
ncbi:uncharacterized protein BXZ73DRAFT_97679 [Epithele typhae]|uniref:uncharacterized protein n=1 Tax=Epithele typhae TaxID=378194 RepID=UPI002008E9E0|nr:uncharacterized protein BXZ73DRAFT_97679 [Epithele typhae]KAH9942262.1 hypothetical protein BXZ73DRAFT_97679 [Epithele typhae]